MTKFILQIIIFSSLLFADDALSSLLEEYESQSALHHKTKDESAGHLILYSRNDLDIMQAHTLKDVLKSTRLFTFQETAKGTAGVQRAGADCGTSGCVRLYVNDQEMSSAVTGSALEIFSEYDLGHVDHVEIYIGGSTIKLGNEYGFLTIKIYTKKPSREKGGFVGLSYATQDSYSTEVFHADVTDDDLEYFLYAKKRYSNNGNISNKGYEVPNYSDNTNIYTTIKRENDFTFEIANYTHEHDASAGVGMQKTPQTSIVDAKYKYVSFTKYIDNLKLQASHSIENNGIENVDPNGIRLFDGSVVNDFNVAFENSITKLGIKNSNKLGNSNFFYGFDFQKKKINLQTSTYVGPRSLDIYSAYLEYEYNFNENNLLVATEKLSYYKQNGVDRSDQYSENRIGFISLLSRDLTMKGFYSHNYNYSPLHELILFPKPIQGNLNLQPMKVDSYTFETIYNNEDHRLSFMYMQLHIKNPIKSVNFTSVNKDIHAVFNDYAIDYSYQFDKENKLMLQYYFTKHNRPYDASPTKGGYIKLFNTVGFFDIYNELIYREGYYSFPYSMPIDDGFDWTASITYKVNKDLTLALKGENLLNRAIASPVPNLYPLETIDQKISLHATWYY